MPLHYYDITPPAAIEYPAYAISFAAIGQPLFSRQLPLSLRFRQPDTLLTPRPAISHIDTPPQIDTPR